MQSEINNAASPRTGSLADIGPKWINKVAWFLRITGVLILVALARYSQPLVVSR
jgi:hypothetical protein